MQIKLSNREVVLRIMKFTCLQSVIAILLINLSWANSGKAQEILSRKVSISAQNEDIESVVGQLEKSARIQFLYSREIVSSKRKVSVYARNETLERVLNNLLTPLKLDYEVVGQQIVLKRNNTASLFPQIRLDAYKTVVAMADIKGQVKDETGMSLPGVSILIKGTTTGTTTDINGKYTIMAAENSTLVFSYVGFQSQEIAVSSHSTLDITLKADTKNLEEAVVVGYGTQRKISVTGSVASVNMEDMKTPVRSLSNALAGKVAGVISMQSGGGEPGYDNPNFTIRGIGTFTGSTSPLIIVDGVQREDVNSTYGGAFNNIDPEDIASISLLKDASATAVYGAKGANGVLIITTKRGSSGKPKISVKVESGVSGLTKIPKMLEGVQWMRLYNEARVNGGENPVYSEETIQKTASGLDPYLYPNVNWTETIYKNLATMYNANINVSGGGDAMKYYVSMSFYDQEGQYKVSQDNGYNPNLNFKRYDFRSNVDINVSKSTVLSLNLAAMLVNSRYPGNSAGDIWYSAFATNPISFPVKYADGKFAGPRNNGGSNPFNLVQNAGYSTEFKPSIQSVFTLSQNLGMITKGLSATGRFSFDSYGEFGTSRTGTNDLWYAGSRGADGNLIFEQVRTGSTYLGYSSYSSGERIMYLEGNIAYDYAVSDHNFGGLLVYNMRNRVIGTAGSLKSSIPYRSQNIAGRVTYAYKEKYLAEVNAGYTGSENFQKGNRFGFFPAASIGWVVSNEQFFKSLKSSIPLFKLRLSRGVTGNDQIGGGDRFGYLTYIDGANGASFGLGPNNYGGIAESVIGAQNLRWEKSLKDNLGIELGLFNKFNVVVDVFKDQRKDILINRSSISPIAGYSSLQIYANMGEMVNKGIDGSVEYNDRFGKDGTLRLFGNLTYAKNTVLFADEPRRTYAYQQWAGHSATEKTGFEHQGLFVNQEDINASPGQFRAVNPGDIKYSDLSGDGMINDNDWKYLNKSSFPKWSYGFGFATGYRKFDLSVLFQGVADVAIMANGGGVSGGNNGASGVGVVPFAGMGQYPANVLANIESRWTEEDPRQDVDYPRLSITNLSDNNFRSSTWWLKDGSFCRLKQASLGYTIVTSNLKKAGFQNVQLYLSATNLLTFSKFKTWDPELGDNGAKYPYARTITLGIRTSL
ncbi:TonB-dependent receptor [Dyadobacter pollutisoli]|uniref:TonB-dependent receptor n=1 Tax=Dyadobacter pollutisoli TaxID=2910158 RepID=A0A9E8NEJ3_9BACT|nr:TonB-dependent receptor [Dyadobacter pollutisoli]WAC13521.1 TonB-dependent receptor [Dyadobacter pollutisoli]